MVWGGSGVGQGEWELVVKMWAVDVWAMGGGGRGIVGGGNGEGEGGRGGEITTLEWEYFRRWLWGNGLDAGPRWLQWCFDGWLYSLEGIVGKDGLLGDFGDVEGESFVWGIAGGGIRLWAGWVGSLETVGQLLRVKKHGDGGARDEGWQLLLSVVALDSELKVGWLGDVEFVDVEKEDLPCKAGFDER
jgi:hypothetical protein